MIKIKYPSEYLGTERIKIDVDKACNTLNDDKSISEFYVNLFSPAEKRYFENVMGFYPGYKSFVDKSKGNLIAKITRVN